MRPICIPNDVTYRIYPKGLDENVKYRIAELDIVKSGATIMQAGLLVKPASGDFTSVTFTLNKAE